MALTSPRLEASEHFTPIPFRAAFKFSSSVISSATRAWQTITRGVLSAALSFSFPKNLFAEHAMLPRSASTNPVVLSYYTMLRMVGLLALALPFALAAGSILAGLLISGHLPHPLLQRSISDYYYTPMRDLYVGSLCAIAAFLASSRGYDLRDEITGYLAAVCAIGVACFPSFNPRSTLFTHWEFAFGLVHTVFAALMYLTLAYICIFLFRKSSPKNFHAPQA